MQRRVDEGRDAGGIWVGSSSQQGDDTIHSCRFSAACAVPLAAAAAAIFTYPESSYCGKSQSAAAVVVASVGIGTRLIGPVS